MPFVPVEDTVQVNIKGDVGAGREWENVYFIFFGNPTPLTQPVTDAIASAFDDAYTASGMLGLLAGAWNINELVATDIATETGPQFSSAGANNVGTDGGHLLAGQTALVVTHLTALRGRSFRGRTYLNGWTESQSDGTPSATAIAAGISLFTNIRAEIIAQVSVDADLAVVSRYSGFHLEGGPDGQLLKKPTPRVAGIATPITGHLVRDVWHTQRRRTFE